MERDREELVLNISELPTIPGVIADTIRVVEDPHASSSEMEWVVSRDQTLTARILRVVNSAAYGFSRRIETVREAIVMLGTRKIKDVAASMAAADLFAGAETDLVAPRQLWEHALATSFWAAQIVERKRLWECASAVTAALLHDLGILILWQYAEDRYRPVLEQVRENDGDFPEVENKELGTTHARVGATLCAKWQLPVSVTMLVNSHHTRSRPSDPALGIVMLANHLAYESGVGPFSWSTPLPLSNSVREMMMWGERDDEFAQERNEIVMDRVAAFREAAGSR